VYHEYGALRMDGWGKLVEEIGSLFYFSVARTYLWGGLYELNYEYSPMEAIDGLENKPEEHYADFDPRGYAFSPQRAAYVGMFADLRTGAGNKYLAYGKMLKPLYFQIDRITLDWYHYNHSKKSPDYNTSGTYEVDSVVHSAWQFKDQSVGFFFANVTDHEISVKVEINMCKYKLAAKDRFTVQRFQNGASSHLFTQGHSEQQSIHLDIPGKNVIMIEVS
jgi:hypothetical protein